MADELHMTVRDLTLRAEKAERERDKIRQCIARFVEVVEAAEAHALHVALGRIVEALRETRDAAKRALGQEP